MANRLKMAEHQAILGLARLGWSQRRIATELGVDRGTVARHVKAALSDPPGAGPPDSNAAISITGSSDTDPLIGAAASNPRGDASAANAAISITGSAGRRSRCEPWRAVIIESLE